MGETKQPSVEVGAGKSRIDFGMGNAAINVQSDLPGKVIHFDCHRRA